MRRAYFFGVEEEISLPDTAKTTQGKATVNVRLSINRPIPPKLLGLSCCDAHMPDDVDLCQLEYWPRVLKGARKNFEMDAFNLVFFSNKEKDLI